MTIITAIIEGDEQGKIIKNGDSFESQSQILCKRKIVQ